MSTAHKPKTNWHLVIWPILALWIVAAIYAFMSDWRGSASVVLPIFMVVAAFLVFLFNAIAGWQSGRAAPTASLSSILSQQRE